MGEFWPKSRGKNSPYELNSRRLKTNHPIAHLYGDAYLVILKRIKLSPESANFILSRYDCSYVANTDMTF